MEFKMGAWNSTLIGNDAVQNELSDLENKDKSFLLKFIDRYVLKLKSLNESIFFRRVC
tara:strand:- start:1773 stop:1946 length:174 start_codon:yes stop_codon:yes gene_type:complete